MIRRWSHLNEINSISNIVLSFKKTFRILIFRRSIHFKRYIRKPYITKLKRKSLIRLKHKTNWLPYFYVIRMWCRDFLFTRQLTSFQYLNKFYLYSFYFFNFNRSHVSNNFIANNFNFIYNSITIKLYSYLNLKQNMNLHGSQLTTAFCEETPILDKTAVPILYDWSTQLIPFNDTIAKDYNLNIFLDTLFELLFFKILELNKILILSLYYNTNTFKNVK